MDPELQAELETQLRQLTDLLSQQSASMVGMGRALEETYSSINTLNSTVKKNSINQTAQNQNISNNTSSQTALQRANASATKMIDEASNNLNIALTNAGSSLNSLGKSILSGEQGFSKYNNTISSLGDTAWNLGKNFGVLGWILGGFLKVTSEVLQYQTKQADSLLGASDSLQKMGAVNSMSVEQIRQMGRGAGLTSIDLEKMIKPMQSVKGGFISLGRTQAEGVKAFGEMIKGTEETRRQFLKLGMSDQDRIQASADFVDYLNQSGQSIRELEGTKGGLAKASLAYTKRVYELADLTGMDVESAKKKLAASSANQSVLLYNADYRRKHNELQKQLDSAKTETEKRAIQQQMSELDNKKKAFDEFTDGLVAAGYEGDELRAYQAQFITGVTTEASKSSAIQGFNIAKIKQELESGAINSAEVAARANEAANRTMDRFGPLGLANEQVIKVTGLTGKIMEEAGKRTGDEIRQAGTAGIKAMEDILKGKGPVGADPAQKARGDLVESERRIRMKIDDYAAKYSPFLGNNSILNKLAWAAGIATTALLALAVMDAVNSAKDFFSMFRRGGKGSGALGKAEGLAAKEAAAAERNIVSKLDKNGRRIYYEEGTGKRIAEAEAKQAQSIRGIDKTGRSYQYDPATGKRISSAAKEAGAIEKEGVQATKGFRRLIPKIFSSGSAKAALGTGVKALANPRTLLKLGTGVAKGIGGLLGGLVLDAATVKLREQGRTQLAAVTDTASYAATGAGIGATIGTIVPGLGNLVGGAVGGAIGGLYGAWVNRKELLPSVFGDDAKAQQEAGDKPAPTPKPPTPIEILRAVLDQVALLQKYKFDPTQVANNAEALGSFANALASVFGVNIGEDTGDKAKAIADASTAFNSAQPPIDKFLFFSNLKINKDQTKDNAEAYVAFAEAMSTYNGTGGVGLTKITNTISMAVAELFKVRLPLDEFVKFANAPIDPKITERNSKSFVNFANAMAEYKGGPGLIDAANALAGKWFNFVTKQDGPVAAFKKFATDDYGPNAASNAEAFYKYAQSIGIIKNSDGSQGGSPSGGSGGGGGSGGSGGNSAGSAGGGASTDGGGGGQASSPAKAPDPALAAKYASEASEMAAKAKHASEQSSQAAAHGDTKSARLWATAASGYAAAAKTLQGKAQEAATGVPGESADGGSALGQGASGAAHGGVIDFTGKIGSKFQFGTTSRQAFIFHHTAGRGNAEGVLETFKARNFPTQYIIDRNGNIVQVLPSGRKGQHILDGEGKGKGLNNSNTEGVEVIANDNSDVLPIQVEAGKRLVSMLGYRANQIYGHGEVNPGHKQPDEGMATVGAIRGSMRAEKGGVFTGPGALDNTVAYPGEASDVFAYPGDQAGKKISAIDPNSILMKLARTPSSESKASKKAASTKTSTQTTINGSTVDEQAIMNLELYGMVSRKIDSMISILESSHDKHHKMLKAARV